MTSPQPVPNAIQSRGTARVVLIVGTVLNVLCLPLAAFWGVMSIMASDAASSPAIDLYVAVNLTLPLAMIVAPIAAWIAFAMKRHTLAILLLLVPIPWTILAFALMFTL